MVRERKRLGMGHSMGHHHPKKTTVVVYVKGVQGFNAKGKYQCLKVTIVLNRRTLEL